MLMPGTLSPFRVTSAPTPVGTGLVTFSISDAGFAVGLCGSSLLLDSQVPGIASNCTSGQEADCEVGFLVVPGGVGTGTCEHPASMYHSRITMTTITARTAS